MNFATLLVATAYNCDGNLGITQEHLVAEPARDAKDHAAQNGTCRIDQVTGFPVSAPYIYTHFQGNVKWH